MSSPVLFDSHAHLTSPRFEEDRDEVIARAREAGVSGIVSIASNPADARRAIALARAESGIRATAGLHPHEAGLTSAALILEIESLAASDEVVAIGETGLDYHYDNAPRELQISNFRSHLELAAGLDLPVVVHSREADDDTARLVREFAGRARGVLHCFAAGEELLTAGLGADWYVSFSGLVTFVPSLADAVRRVPADRLLIETDAPYLAPEPRRGRRNEPAFVVHTCRRVAEIREETHEDVARATTANARAFYGLDAEAA